MLVAIDTESHLSKMLCILRVKASGSYIDWSAHRRHSELGFTFCFNFKTIAVINQMENPWGIQLP